VERASLFVLASVVVGSAAIGLFLFSGPKKTPEPVGEQGDRPAGWAVGGEAAGHRDTPPGWTVEDRRKQPHQRTAKGAAQGPDEEGADELGGSSISARSFARRNARGASKQIGSGSISVPQPAAEPLVAGGSGDTIGGVGQPQRQAPSGGGGQRTEAAPPGKGAADVPAPPDEQAKPQDHVVLSVPLLGTTDAENSTTQPFAVQNVKPLDNGKGMDFPEDAVLGFPDAGNLSSEAGTISFDVTPHWNGADPGHNSFVQVRTPDMWEGRLAVFRDGNILGFTFLNDQNQETGIGVPIPDWTAGDPHKIAVTWGEALMSLYIDGELAGQHTYANGPDIPPGTPLFLGSNPHSHILGAGAIMQDFKIFDRPLAPNEVAAQ
jgi:hypothetical protein